MANPLLNIIEKHLGADFLPGLGRYCMGLKRQMAGLAEDFWKDGKDNPLKQAGEFVAKKPADTGPGASFHRVMSAAREHAAAEPWHAEASEIAEKMWGDGWVLPGGAVVTEWLANPLGLIKDMSVLDMSAGLGTAAQNLQQKFHAKVTALEADTAIAARGGLNGVVSYDTDDFKAADKYDCIMAREIFFRQQDRKRLILQIAAVTKPAGQVSFTDYIVDNENRDKPAVAAWQAFEKIPAPLGVVEVAEVWAKAGFNLRIHEDQTEFYRKEVPAGLRRFAMHLATASRPDAATKKVILQQIQLWVHRMAAMEQGMKFYRFYGVKQ